MRARNVAVRARPIDLLLGRRQVLAQGPPAIEHRLREGGLCLLRLQFGLLDGHVECHQYGACIDDLPRREPNQVDRAGEFVAQRDRT
jgi:hypothetical protein